jgi:hypothetical protein
MNYENKIRWDSKLKLLIRNRHPNMFHYNSHNSKEHELIKFLIYCKLIDLGFETHIEAIFKDGSGIADIVAIKDGFGYIIEVMKSETEEKMLEKKKKYPTDFEIIPIKTKNFKIDEFEI